MSATKIGGNTNNIFKLLFFKINLLFGTSDKISAHGKLILLPIRTVFFWSSLLEKWKEDWCGLKYATSFLYSVSKEAPHKPLNIAATTDTTYFDECFPFYVINANSIFYINLLLPRGLMQPPCCCVLSNKCLKRSPYFISIISTIILR